MTVKSFKVIYLYFTNSLQQNLANPSAFVIFFIAKILRYGLFILFLFLLVGQISQIQGYTREQMLFFYLIFNLIDTSAQLLFREVYRFRPLVVSGGFDMVLTKPFSPLLRSLVGGPDFIDLGIFIVLLLLTTYVIGLLQPTVFNLLLFLLLFINSLVLAAAFHICVLAIGILTLSVDHLIMIYRDLTSLMRIPVDLFTDPLKALLTFVIPIGIMFTFPAKTLLGLLSWPLITTSLLIGILCLFLAIRFWCYALKNYSSAGS